MRLRLATRGSALARTQSGMVAAALGALGHEVELVLVTTHGDVSSAPLATLGGTGVFVGAVRAAVLAGEADFAVHSFKDLPTAAADGLALAAVPPREDPADALCARDGLDLAGLPIGARVGTGSPRRAAQLQALRPDLETVAIRGNVETRLGRVSADLDAVMLAAAGLRRLGLAEAITERLDPAHFLPAPAQGALAIECRADAPAALRRALARLDDEPTRLAALAERAVLSRLEAGCAAPVGAFGQVFGDRIELTAAVVAVDGSTRLVEQGHGAATGSGAEALGVEVAEALLAAGADRVADLGARGPRPLSGRVVLLPQRSPAGAADALAAAGVEVVATAITRPEPLPPDDFLAALAETWDWVVVTSAQTVATLRAAGVDLADRLGAIRVAAVGPATATALARAGVTAALVASPGGGRALVEQFGDGPGRVLLPGAEAPSLEPGKGLAAKGWTVQSVPVYRTAPADLPDAVVADWRAGRFDVVVVTAGSVARAAVRACGLPGPRVVALGETSAAAARASGLEVAAIAARPDAAALVDAVLAVLR